MTTKQDVLEVVEAAQGSILQAGKDLADLHDPRIGKAITDFNSRLAQIRMAVQALP
jgi:hypothetical protein